IAAAPKGNKRINKPRKVRSTRGLEVPHNVDLVLERALNPSVSKTVMKGTMVEGNATISPTEIIELSATISMGSSKEQDISLASAKINDGGQFEGEYDGNMVTGIVTNNGQGGYRIRFATGPLQGTMLNFVTDEEFDKIQTREEEDAYLKAEQNEIVKAIQRENGIQAKEKSRSIATERDSEEEDEEFEVRNINQESEDGEEGQVQKVDGERQYLTEEEITEVTNEKGFDFNSPVERANFELKNIRKPASHSGADQIID
ncbi:MAG: hypothetical protein HOM21_09710, partial [Halobacteriovoraceae bacterium]|nr:hypothetical protein [Halobacteriovoraceae bacterium]